MATVYLARDLKHRRHVALKVLHPDLSHSVGAGRFLREIETAANLTHPHILPLHDSGEAAGALYYVMPYVEGESLRNRLTRETQLPVDDALTIAREVAGALAYAHRHGIVHRDIKPENILLSGGHALVADFGIAKAVGPAADESLTKTGLAMGTAAYMSPEQSTGSIVDGRTDVYSLGCVFYEMLVGEPPFTGPSAQAIVAKRFSDAVPSVRRLRPSVTPAVEHVVSKALALTPADRFASADELARGLAPEAIGPTMTLAAPNVGIHSGHSATAPPHPARGRMLRLIAGGVMLLILGVAALLATRGHWRSSSPALDTKLVVVAPFRVASGDPSFGYLREGLVDLLAAKLTGDAGLPRAADPRLVLSAWRGAVGRDSSELPQQVALRLAQRLGAGQLLLGNAVVSPDRISLNASVLAVPAGTVRAETSVDGPPDSLLPLVDRLAAKVLSLSAGEGEQRLAALTSTSLPALKAYLEGQALYRRGHYAESAVPFNRALDLDSTFALAALGLLAGGVRTSDWEAIERGRELVSRARARLSRRDQAHMVVLVGVFSDTASYSRLMDAAEQFVHVAPDRVEAWTCLADLLFGFGDLLGVRMANRRAAAAYARAVEIDSTFAPAVEGVVLTAARSGDTATVRRLGTNYLGIDSATEISSSHWRVAVALADSLALARVRAQFGSMDIAELEWITQLSQYDGVSLEDGDRAIATALRRESRTGSRDALLLEAAAIALNRGRPARALGIRHEQRGTSRLQVLDALYWDGDSAAAAAAVRDLEAQQKRLAPGALRHFNSCVLEQWRIAHGKLGTTQRALEDMRGAKVSAQYGADQVAIVQGCATLLEALFAVAAKRNDASVYVERLDSVMLTAPPYIVSYGGAQAWNLLVARLKESRGDLPGALAAVRRRLYMTGSPLYLSTYLREEGRLASIAGDTEGAVRAYHHYLALRSDADSSLRSGVAQVRAAFARLVGEPGQ